jgi:hypothetical protein
MLDFSSQYGVFVDDIEFYTNHLPESHKDYFNQNIYNYWISSSHNTYLPYGQVMDPSNSCYYKLILNLYFGGCIEIDTDSVSPDKQDILITHLPTNSKKIKLSEIFEIVVDAINNKIAKGIVSGPVIMTFDNKKLVKKEEHEIFWKVLERYLLNAQNYTMVAVIDDKFDLTQLKISELSNKILLRWGENKNNCNVIKGNDGMEIAIKPTDKVGKDLCRPPPNFLSSNPNFNYIKTANSWLHLKKGPHELVDQITKSTIKVSNQTVSASYDPLITAKEVLSLNTVKSIMANKKIELPPATPPPNVNQIVNLQRNLMRIYPHMSYTLSQNYDNMAFFRNGVQITALNLQYLSNPWFLNSAVFMPAYGVACSPFKTKAAQNANEKCFNGWDSLFLPNQFKVARDDPLAYRLKPLWLLGLLPYPKLYTLKLSIQELHKVDETKGNSRTNDVDEYPIFNVVYGLNNNSASTNSKQQVVTINNVDPTVPFFVLEVVKSGSFGLGLSKAFSTVNIGSKYKGGAEIPWSINKLKGEVLITMHKIRRTISGNYNKVELDDNCENSNIFNSRKQIEAKVSFEWIATAEIPEVKMFNLSINNLRREVSYKDKKVVDFLSDLKLFTKYQTDLMNKVSELRLTEKQPSKEKLVEEDAEAAHYSDNMPSLIKDAKPTDVKAVTDE